MKFLKSLLATFLSLILLFAVAFFTGWIVTGTYDITKWFKSKPIEGEQGGNPPIDGSNSGVDGNSPGNGEIKTETNDNLIVSMEDNEGIQLMRERIAPDEFEAYGVSPQAKSAFTLTATVKDINGNTPTAMQYVTFEMPNGSSDSVKMTVVDNVTARFECLKAFNTYINVKVISTLDTSKFTTVKLGYRPDIDSIHVMWSTYDTSNSIANIVADVKNHAGFQKDFLPMKEYGNYDNASHRFGFSIYKNMINWGVGTETPSYDTVNVTFAPSGEVNSRLKYTLGISHDLSYTETFDVRLLDEGEFRQISEDRLFRGLGLSYDSVYDYLTILDGNMTYDFFIMLKFSNSETGEEWAADLMLAVSVPNIGAVGGVVTDKDTIIFN